MSPITAILNGYRNFFNFQGKATRSEFWYFYLFWIITYFIAIGSENIFFIIISLISLIPSYSVQVRRLHDIGKSGWNIFIYFIPIIGIIFFFIWNCKPSVTGQYYDMFETLNELGFDADEKGYLSHDDSFQEINSQQKNKSDDADDIFKKLDDAPKDYGKK